MRNPLRIHASNHFGLELEATSGKTSGERACLGSRTDPIRYPMIASLLAGTFTKSSDMQRRGGEEYRFKAHMIVRGFEMEKGVDYADNFSPTQGLATRPGVHSKIVSVSHSENFSPSQPFERKVVQIGRDHD